MPSEAERLHGSWNDTGSRRWCADCGIWVRLEDWQDHKREEAKLVTDGGVVLPFATPDGDHHTRAPPEAQTYDTDGNPYVWIRTADGDVTRAYQRGSV